MTVETYHSTDELVWCVVEAVVLAGHVQTGDLVAVLAGALTFPAAPPTCCGWFASRTAPSVRWPGCPIPAR